MSIQNGVYNDQIGCFVVSHSYDSPTHTGTLILKSESECDMTGCIKSFKSIDPSVEKIQVHTRFKEDISYKRDNGKWQACEPKTGIVIGEFKESDFK